jgi:hypothetical protein
MGRDQGGGSFARRAGLLQGAVSAVLPQHQPAHRGECRPTTRFPVGRVSTRQSCGPCVVVNPERQSALRCHGGRRRPDVPREFTPAPQPTRIGHRVSFGVTDARVRDSTLRSIVIAKLGDQKGVFTYAVDHAVFFGDASRPVARQGVFERFRFPGAGKRFALRIANQLVDSLDQAPVLTLPIQIVIPGGFGKDADDGVSSRRRWSQFLTLQTIGSVLDFAFTTTETSPPPYGPGRRCRTVKRSQRSSE